MTFARYTATQDVGHGIGALLAGLPSLLLLLMPSMAPAAPRPGRWAWPA